MTRKERMLASIRRKPVDCVPHATYNIYPFPGSQHLDDPSYAAILDRIRAGAGAALKVGCGCGEACMPRECLRAETEGSGEDRIQRTTLSTPKGDLVSVIRAPENKPAMTVKHLLATDDVALTALPRNRLRRGDACTAPAGPS